MEGEQVRRPPTNNFLASFTLTHAGGLTLLAVTVP
jgi:hypothetical protein